MLVVDRHSESSMPNILISELLPLEPSTHGVFIQYLRFISIVGHEIVIKNLISSESRTLKHDHAISLITLHLRNWVACNHSVHEVVLRANQLLLTSVQLHSSNLALERGQTALTSYHQLHQIQRLMLSRDINHSNLLSVHLQETLGSLAHRIISKVNISPLAFNVDISHVIKSILILSVLVNSAEMECTLIQV